MLTAVGCILYRRSPTGLRLGRRHAGVAGLFGGAGTALRRPFPAEQGGAEVARLEAERRQLHPTVAVFEARPLEVLHRGRRAILGIAGVLLGDRVAEDGQPAVRLPELFEAAGDGVSG